MERPAQRRLFDLGRESRDRDGAEDGSGPWTDRERVVDRVRKQVRPSVGIDLCVGIALVRQRARQASLRALVGVLVEARSLRKRVVRGRPGGVADGRGQRLEAVDPNPSIRRRWPLLDDDLDAHVLGAAGNDPRGARVGLEKPVALVVALDPGEVPLQRRRVEDRILVDDPAKEPEKLGARRRGELVAHVAFVESLGTDDVHGVDDRAPRRDGGAPCARQGGHEARASSHDGKVHARHAGRSGILCFTVSRCAPPRFGW